MNERQEKILCKEFKVNEHYSICRGDYESLPLSMFAWKFTDNQMEFLAYCISCELHDYDENNPDKYDEEFWRAMEENACALGMKYYEDMTEKQCKQLDKEWEELK